MPMKKIDKKINPSCFSFQSIAMPMKKFDNKIEPTPQNLLSFYKLRCRKNLHIVLCFSPIGEKFRSRSLKFPALVAGCTMDW